MESGGLSRLTWFESDDSVAVADPLGHWDCSRRAHSKFEHYIYSVSNSWSQITSTLYNAPSSQSVAIVTKPVLCRNEWCPAAANMLETLIVLGLSHRWASFSVFWRLSLEFCSLQLIVGKDSGNCCSLQFLPPILPSLLKVRRLEVNLRRKLYCRLNACTTRL